MQERKIRFGIERIDSIEKAEAYDEELYKEIVEEFETFFSYIKSVHLDSISINKPTCH